MTQENFNQHRMEVLRLTELVTETTKLQADYSQEIKKIRELVAQHEELTDGNHRAVGKIKGELETHIKDYTNFCHYNFRTVSE